MALSLYNKYRPQTFSDVVGQNHVEKTLANAVDKNTVSHAYLFCGPRGTGKTTTARILAKALLCDKAPTKEPDGTCEHCKEISDGVHPDVYELDAASRTGVDNVREEIIGRVHFAPTHGKYKIYIIDEVHMLSTPAFNALLKTLEEPPPHVVFMLCTTDVHKVPDTVQARCQRFDFKRLSAKEIVGRLQYICEREGFDSEPAALELIAQRSQGGMRDAIRSLEQVAVFNSGMISYSAAESLLGMVDAEQLFVLCDVLAAGDAAGCFEWVASYVQSGSDIAILVNDLAGHIRNLYAVSVARSADERLISALEIDAEALPRLREQASLFHSTSRLAWMLSVLGTLSSELKSIANARLALEITLTRMLRPESEHSLDALAVRIAELEARVASGGVSAPTTAPTTAPAVTSGSSSAEPSAQHPGHDEAQRASAAPVLDNGAQGEGLLQSEELSQSESRPSSQHSETASASLQGEAASQLNQTQTQPVDAPMPDAGDTTDPAESGQNISDHEPGFAHGTTKLPQDEQSLYRTWDSVVDAIKKEKRGVAASLGGITPRLSSSGTHLTLELPASATTSRQYLETNGNKALIDTTVAKIFGAPLQVSFAFAAEPANHAAALTYEGMSDAPGGGALPKSEQEGEPAQTGVSLEANVAETVNAASDAQSTAQSSDVQTGEQTPAQGAGQSTGAEPSKEELDNILANSLNTRIHFEEQ